MNAPARLAAWLSITSLLGIVPHVMEDARYGQAANFHMTIVQFEWFSALVVGATAAAALACLAGSRFGAYAVLVIGVLWAGLGAADHYRALLLDAFRDGMSSRVWIFLLVGLQGAAAIVATLAIRRSPAIDRASSRT